MHGDGGRRKRRWILFALFPAALLLSACQATGVGWIPSSVDPTAKATFGFSYDVSSTDGASSLSGSYHDPQGQTVFGVVDVSLKGTGQLRGCDRSDPACQAAPAATKGGCLTGVPTYRSQNPGLPGGGDFSLLVCDVDGDGQVSPTGADFLSIAVISGPYTGYHDEGNPQGNITVKQ
jgi:hypothetical protein